MKLRTNIAAVCAICLAFSFCALIGCGPDSGTPISSSGVSKATTKVPVDANGRTIEQENVIERLKRDNTPGSTKYLYIISPFSGDVLIFSSVKGKVSSSGKRFSPTSVEAYVSPGSNYYYPMFVDIGGKTYGTNEVLQDDGSYGSSSEYIYWFDQRNVYHQHLVNG